MTDKKTEATTPTTAPTTAPTISLLSLMKKANYQLIDAVIAYGKGQLVIDAKSINEVLAKLEDKQTAKVTVQFLIDLVNHNAMFDALYDQYENAISESKRAEMTADEIDIFATGKAITTFKALNKLRGVVTPEQASEFLKAE